MTRTTLLTIMLLVAAVVSARSRAIADAPSTSRPNILLIVTDDQGMHLSCLGTPGIKTPNIDALAARGTLFLNAYTTCASCSPSRSSLLTGMYPHSNGHWRNTHGPTPADPPEAFQRGGKVHDEVGVHEDVATLPEMFGEAGYFTGITQKFHLSPPWKYPFDFRAPAGHAADASRQVVARFLKEAGDRPFFLMANIGNTHRPFRRGRASDKDRVDPRAIDVPACFPDTPVMREDLADYFTTVQEADACVGGVLHALETSGKVDDTIICFLSDHGYPYTRAKATVYDAGIHVPMIFAGPGVKRGVRTTELLSEIDIAPTVLDFAGVAIPETMQGLSIRLMLEGELVARRRELVFAEHNAHGPGEASIYPMRSVTDGRLIYVRNLMPERTYTPPADLLPGGPWGNHAYQAIVDAKEAFPLPYAALQRTLHRPAEELYDLTIDPRELLNRIDDPTYTQRLATLRAAMDDWQEESDDPGDPRTIVRRE